MKSNILPAIRLTLVMLIVCAVIYPAIIWGISYITPNKGDAEHIQQDGKSFYTNLAQRFSADNYFSSRPSAVAYNAAGSGGSNKGTSNPDYLKEVQGRIDSFSLHNPGINKSDIPSDLVTASGSGLDPDISVMAAKVQAKRIAALRMLPEDSIQKLIVSLTEKPLLRLFGPEKINVLKLNLALDRMHK